jgi:hypothetical protein
MPRSITRPQVGSMVWYYAAPTAVNPQAAIVLGVVDKTHLALTWFAAADGAATFAGNVLYTDGSVKVTSGAWCTYMRINAFTAGTSPNSEALDYELAGLTLEQREARLDAIAAKQEAEFALLPGREQVPPQV